MPLRLPLRTGSLKSSAFSGRRKSISSHHEPSSTRPSRSSHPQSSSSTRRARSHEGDRGRPPPAPSAHSRHEEPRRPGPPRRRSTHRSSISPSSSPRRRSSTRDDRGRRSRHSPRRQSPSPFSRRASSRERYSRGRSERHDSERRGRASPTKPPSVVVSPPRTQTGKLDLPKPTFASHIIDKPIHDPPPLQPPTSNHRSSTPLKYRPAGVNKSPESPSRKSSHAATDSPRRPVREYGHVEEHNSNHPSSVSPRHSHSQEGGIFSKLPETLATHAAISSLSKHAGTAKEWAGRLNELQGAPEEIQNLTARVTTARDTIAQIEGSIKARPDLLEDEAGQKLKGQIEEAIESTSKTLNDMTKTLEELTAHFMGRGAAWESLNDLWISYKYKTEGEEKVKSADEELQKELTALSTLMVNLYSRALTKPVPTPEPPQSSPSSAASTPGTAATQPQGGSESHAPVPKEVSFNVPSGAEASGKYLPKRAATVSSTSTTATPNDASESKDMTGQDADAGAHSISPSRAASAQEIAESAPQHHRETNSHGSHDDPEHAGSPTSEQPERDSRQPDKDPQDAILDAAWDGDLDGVAKALRHVSPSVCDLRGLTPLHLASERDHLAIAMMLIDRGADVKARANGGRMPLHLAARYASADMIEMLIERGRANPNAQTSDGRTALHYAASSAEDGNEERRETIRALRDCGANPTIQDRRGETARDVAQKRDFWDAASTLRRAEKRWDEDHHQNWLQRHGLTK